MESDTSRILTGDYIAGFVDGEGCFALKFRREVKAKRKGSPIYFYWDIEFAIVLRKDDINLLESISHTLECGKISLSKNSARLSVNKIEDLALRIVPFFNKHELRGKKYKDFILWKEAVNLFFRNQRKGINRSPNEPGFSRTIWLKEDTDRLILIQREMEPYKSHRSKPWKWIKQAGKDI